VVGIWRGFITFTVEEGFFEALLLLESVGKCVDEPDAPGTGDLAVGLGLAVVWGILLLDAAELEASPLDLV